MYGRRSMMVAFAKVQFYGMSSSKIVSSNSVSVYKL